MALFERTTSTDRCSTGISGGTRWPDARRVRQIRHTITQSVSGQKEDFFPLGRQQLLEVLTSMNGVDAQVLRLIDGIGVCLGNIDIDDYRNAILRLDKPGRTEQENLALLGYQEEIANVLLQALDEARHYVDALDGRLQTLERVSIELNQPRIRELESRLDSERADEQDGYILRLLEELKGPGEVAVAKDCYVYEVRKLIVAMGFFFDNVLQGSPEVIRRAEDFNRHVGSLIVALQRLRDNWES